MDDVWLGGWIERENTNFSFNNNFQSWQEPKSEPIIDNLVFTLMNQDRVWTLE